MKTTVRKNNPDLVSTFANLAFGVANTLAIKDRLDAPKKKVMKRRANPKAAATKRKPFVRQTNGKKSARPKGDLYMLTISSGDDIESVFLHDGDKDGFSKKFRTMAGAKTWATKNKKKLVPNPQNLKIARKRNVPGFVDENGVFHPIRSGEGYSSAAAGDHKSASRKRSDARRNLKAAHKKAPTKKQKTVIARTFAKREGVTIAETQKQLAKPRVNPAKKKTARPNGIRSFLRKRKLKKTAKRLSAQLWKVAGTHKETGRRADIAETYIAINAADAKRQARYDFPILKSLTARKVNPPPTVRRSMNPQQIRSATFEKFQGRKPEGVTRVECSEHAPKQMAQLGRLVAFKLLDEKQERAMNPSKARLCAANGRLWIVGQRVARPDAGQPARVLNPIGDLDYVVYETHKPHHGDQPGTNYIHHLGDEGGTLPLMCVDRDGFAVLKGGQYKIKAEGIRD